LELRKDYLEGEAIETIYWGGGTPSLLQAGDFEMVFNAINRLFGTSSCREITIEANPDDMTGEYLASLQRLPFNRISIGVQSFNDNELRLLNRRHTAEQALDAIARCQKAGYSNLSIDLIYGLPGQTPEIWDDNLSQALRLNLPHLSAYHLSYEEGTAMYQQLNEGLMEPVSEETSLLLFDRLTEKLEAAGYLHYEISNFCRPGCFSRHNTAYWTDRNYLGIGPAAHSYNHHSRQWNIASLPEYIEGIANGRPAIEKEVINNKTRYNEYLMTRLRTMWGIDLVTFLEIFGKKQTNYLLQQATPYLQNGLMEKDENNLRITKKGYFTADGIIRDLMTLHLVN
jgi:oxygen-independent coproporphyrinogen-3 oxidase